MANFSSNGLLWSYIFFLFKRICLPTYADIATGAENTKIVEETVTIATAEEAVDNEHERVNETENATAEEVYSKETPDCKEVCENDDCICEPDRNHCKICKSCSRETVDCWRSG